MFAGWFTGIYSRKKVAVAIVSATLIFRAPDQKNAEIDFNYYSLNHHSAIIFIKITLLNGR